MIYTDGVNILEKVDGKWYWRWYRDLLLKEWVNCKDLSKSSIIGWDERLRKGEIWPIDDNDLFLLLL